MANKNSLETIPYKIDVPGMEAKIKTIPNVDSLMRFARNFTIYHELGIITAPVCLKAIIHKKLESLINDKYNNRKTDEN